MRRYVIWGLVAILGLFLCYGALRLYAKPGPNEFDMQDDHRARYRIHLAVPQESWKYIPKEVLPDEYDVGLYQEDPFGLIMFAVAVARTEDTPRMAIMAFMTQTSGVLQGGAVRFREGRDGTWARFSVSSGGTVVSVVIRRAPDDPEFFLCFFAARHEGAQGYPVEKVFETFVWKTEFTKRPF